jgi:glycosyltransferase involved in cell wall biosynthesis
MTADTVGGVWTYAVDLARALAGRGVDVALATMGAPVQPHQRAALAGLGGVTLHESAYRLEWMDSPWRDVDLAGQWLLALERQWRPDLVHLNQFSFGALPFRAPTLVVGHSCVLSWWRAVHGETAPAAWDGYRRRVRDGLAGAALVAAPSRAMLQSLAREYGALPAGLVLPNGRSPDLFRPAAKQPFILAAGRLWDPAKNLAALQAVAPGLPWPVRVAGSTAHPGGGALQTDGLQCLGELAPAALAGQMGAASIYALPARYEPFGLSVLEAALSGCALVLGDIASLRETWGAAAIYVAPGDHDALRLALQQLIAQPAERQRLAAAARSRAMPFSAERMAQGTLAAYAMLQPRFAATTAKELQCA